VVFDLSYGITIEGIRQSALYAAQKGVRFALEYKLKEPRTHSYLARATDTSYEIT
jgi:hypothetical protein